jgi:glycosyltransferase involved in cell wall biosynthesis
MKIWIFNHYASTPDQPMTGAYYLAKALVDRGHQVRIFASSYSYYKHKEIRLTASQWQKYESFEGIQYVWVRTLPHTTKLWSRALNMFSYGFTSICAALLALERPDVVIGTCPHLLAPFCAYVVSVLKRGKLVFEVRDLWPQVLVDEGKLSNKAFIALLRSIETFLYRKAHLILTVWPFAYEYIEECGVKREKVVWIPNGVDTSKYSSRSAKSSNGNAVFMYIGGHSSYQGIDTILEAAKILQDEAVGEVQFVFIGDGSEKANLKDYAKRLDLRNVEFRDVVPRSRLSEAMNEASVMIFHLNDIDTLRKYGSSSNKICDYLLSGRPVLHASSVRNNAVEEAQAGISVPPEDPAAMAEALKRFLRMSEIEKHAMAARGMQYALANFDIHQLAERAEAVLSNTLTAG